MPQRRNALVAVDHHVARGVLSAVVLSQDHHNRRLLACCGERGQQAPLALPVVRPQMLPALVELVKLQLHAAN